MRFSGILVGLLFVLFGNTVYAGEVPSPVNQEKDPIEAVACGVYLAGGNPAPAPEDIGQAKVDNWKKLYETAEALRKAGKLACALETSTKALETATQDFGDVHLNAALAYALQARIYMGLRQYTKADKLFRQAETVLMKAFAIKGLDPMALNRESIKYPGVADILIHRAELYIIRAMFREAELSLKAVIQMLESHGNPYGAEMAEALYLFAGMHRTMKMFEEAEQYYKRAMHIIENAVGIAHIDYVKTLIGIAANYHTQKKYIESEMYYRKALAIIDEIKGPASKEAKLIRAALSVLYEEQGLHYDAIRLKTAEE
ncbi:MAG: tetratricopeptide repeat protein [Thermodesulfovibrionales bacterium]|nr:tetratricopeptide repeat protein [Thermodesulfovibrionales bacterium]